MFSNIEKFYKNEKVKVRELKKMNWIAHRWWKSQSLIGNWKSLLGIILYSRFIAWAELRWKMDFMLHPGFKNLPIFFSMIGFILSLLLVFRTNTAYERWWEGRKLWGNLINTSRNFAIKLNACGEHLNENDRKYFQKAIPLFADALDKHLKSEKVRLELDEFEINHDHKHPPLLITQWVQQRIFQLQEQKRIDDFRFQALIKDVDVWMDICGACERIKNTPIPFSYAAFIKNFIIGFSLMVPLGLVPTLGIIAVPVTCILFYALMSLETIAEEIEEPFGNDPNDLPTQKMVETIRANVTEILKN